MHKPSTLLVASCSAALLFLTTGPPVSAAQPDPALGQRVEALEKELRRLKEELKQAQNKAEEASSEAYAEERAAHKFHLAGYASAGFETSDEETDSFSAGSFNPMFHYQYNDSILFESELEFETSEDGETELELEYADVNWFVNDYVTVRVGKWLSPIGQFQERLHPDWINKLPEAPAGFGHGGAQPLSDVGVQVRGGVPFGKSLLTYAFAVGNGPRVGHHGPELEGFGADDNDNKSVGGRIGILPVPNVEIGASYKTADIDGEERGGGPCDATGPDEACGPTDGGYDLWGVDFAITPGTWELRGEFLHSELDSLFSREGHGDAHTTRLPETEWEAWYVQASYQLRGIAQASVLARLEPVVRYGEFEVDGFEEFAEGAEDRWTVGINYLFAPSLIAKLAWESREFDAPGQDDDVRVLGQIAYGF